MNIEDEKPDYRFYTLAQLYDVHSNIDKEAYPERYQELLKELTARQELLKELTARQNGETKQVSPESRKNDENFNNKEGSKEKLLSPAQIAIGSFWGGPIAAVYYLRKNYLSLGKDDYAQKSLSYGFLFIIFLIGLLPFLPEKFPNLVIPIIYCLSVEQIAATTQLKKEQIEKSDKYSFESNWKIFGVGILTLSLFLLIACGVLVVLDAAGIVRLA